jgi:hypothetical protein
MRQLRDTSRCRIAAVRTCKIDIPSRRWWGNLQIAQPAKRAKSQLKPAPPKQYFPNNAHEACCFHRRSSGFIGGQALFSLVLPEVA